METDVARIMEFRPSPIRLFWLGLGALAMAIASFAMARAYFGTGNIREFIGWAGALFFGACFLIAIWRSFRMNQPTLTLSSEGFRDTRISSEFIPWTTVEKISVWRHRSANAIVVKVSETVWEDFPLSRLARWSRSANRSLGADGLSIGTSELRVKFDDILAMMQTYATAHGGKVG
jgi:hypothetical protein